MAVTVKRKAGRPKGSRDKGPRKRASSADVEKLKRTVATMEKKLKAVEAENVRLISAVDDANPIDLTPATESDEPVSEGELVHIASGGTKPIEPSDEVMAILHRRAQVQRLLLRGVTRAVIAQHLGISTSTLTNDIRHIRRDWRDSVNEYNISEAVGESLVFYREVRDLALREASNPLNKATDIIGAAAAALRAEDSKNAFLARLGLYDVLDQEKRDAFKQGKTRELSQDADEFNNVLSFMHTAATKGGSEIEDVLEAAEFSDVEPLPDE